jgi:hypothetical protein
MGSDRQSFSILIIYDLRSMLKLLLQSFALILISLSFMAFRSRVELALYD